MLAQQREGAMLPWWVALGHIHRAVGRLLWRLGISFLFRDKQKQNKTEKKTMGGETEKAGINRFHRGKKSKVAALKQVRSLAFCSFHQDIKNHS